MECKDGWGKNEIFLLNDFVIDKKLYFIMHDIDWNCN